MRKLLLLCVASLWLTGCISIPPLNNILLRPSAKTSLPPDGTNYTEINLPVGDPQDGRYINLWHIKSDVGSKALVVIVPGSDANKSRYLEGLPVFMPYGYDLILMDYEGFGSSPGDLSLANIVDDAEAVTDYALLQHDKVFLFGVSVGTPLVVKSAADHPRVKGVIMEGTLILSQEPQLWLEQNNLGIPLFWQVAGWWTAPQIPEAFDILKYIKEVNQPKLFMHSTEDETTPYVGGVEVYNAAPDPKEFFTEHGGHGEMIRLDQDAYTAKVIGWLDEHVQ